jgi:D-alanine-D-alanine ligase
MELPVKIAFLHNVKTTSEEQTEAALSTSLKRLGHSVFLLDLCAPVQEVISQLLSIDPDLVFNGAENREGQRKDFYALLFEEMKWPYLDSVLNPANVDIILEKIIQSAEKKWQLKPAKKEGKEPLTVGVLYNLKRVSPTEDGENDNEAEFDSESTINAIKTALTSLGHNPVCLEATQDLPARLQIVKPDIVFNIAEGIHGRSREAQAPALLELLGIEYSGSESATMSLTLDKIMAKKLVKEEHVLTPDYIQIITGKEKLPSSLKFPIILKPAAEGSSKGIFDSSVVNSEEELRSLAYRLIEKYKQPIMAEQYIKGREFTVGLLGNKKPKILPIMEIVFLDKNRPHPVYSFEYKLNYSKDVRYDIPAQVSPSLQSKIEKTARQCFDILACRDVARIDFRVDAKEDVYFLECNPLPGLAPDWSDLCLMAKVANLDYKLLIAEILAPALKRFRERRKLEFMRAT